MRILTRLLDHHIPSATDVFHFGGDGCFQYRFKRKGIVIVHSDKVLCCLLRKTYYHELMRHTLCVEHVLFEYEIYQKVC